MPHKKNASGILQNVKSFKARNRNRQPSVRKLQQQTNRRADVHRHKHRRNAHPAHLRKMQRPQPQQMDSPNERRMSLQGFFSQFMGIPHASVSINSTSAWGGLFALHRLTAAHSSTSFQNCSAGATIPNVKNIFTTYIFQ